jgi:hypothetical protein
LSEAANAFRMFPIVVKRINFHVHNFHAKITRSEFSVNINFLV